MAIKTLEAATDLIRFNDVASAESYIDEVEAFFRDKMTQLRRGLNSPVLARMFVASYSHPHPRTNKHLDILYELFDKVSVLESVYATLVSKFGTMSKAVTLISRTQALLISCRKKVNKALLALSNCVENHQPDYFRKCHVELLSLLRRHKSHFEAVNPIYLSRVIVSPENTVLGTQFCVYYQFVGLTDKSGYRHERYHIAVSCMVDTYGGYSMNFCLQPTLLLPGKFRSSNFFASSTDAYNKLRKHMLEEGFDWSDQ